MTKRAVNYSRYSTDNQRPASINDQNEICRRYIERNGWIFLGSYEDAAMSGASTLLRPEFLRLVADAAVRRFDVIVVEGIDRLARNVSDITGLIDKLAFWGVELHTPAGPINLLSSTIEALLAQVTLSETGRKTWRGQLGRARAGRIPGGLAYEYEVVSTGPGDDGAGKRRIKDDEAEIVRRIFRDTAAGKKPRQIARELNEAKIPGPGGRPWIDTTIRGQPARGTGILNNTIYIGRLDWNRCGYVKNPQTGKRVAR